MATEEGEPLKCVKGHRKGLKMLPRGSQHPVPGEGSLSLPTPWPWADKQNPTVSKSHRRDLSGFWIWLLKLSPGEVNVEVLSLIVLNWGVCEVWWALSCCMKSPSWWNIWMDDFLLQVKEECWGCLKYSRADWFVLFCWIRNGNKSWWSTWCSCGKVEREPSAMRSPRCIHRPCFRRKKGKREGLGGGLFW